MCWCCADDDGTSAADFLGPWVQQQPAHGDHNHPQLPIRGGDPSMRKSSAATTGTITPETSIPHFSIAHRSESFSHGRPGSSNSNINSMATDHLKRITREDSAGSQGTVNRESRQGSQGSRWGSVISGLWSARRRDSAVGSIKTSDAWSNEQNKGSTSPTRATYNPSRRLSGMMAEPLSPKQPDEQARKSQCPPPPPHSAASRASSRY